MLDCLGISDPRLFGPTHNDFDSSIRGHLPRILSSYLSCRKQVCCLPFHFGIFWEEKIMCVKFVATETVCAGIYST